MSYREKQEKPVLFKELKMDYLLFTKAMFHPIKARTCD